jgi:hypothetical protein
LATNEKGDIAMTEKDEKSSPTVSEIYEMHKRVHGIKDAIDTAREERQQRLDHLSDEQREAISDIAKACEVIMSAYQEMYHPNWEDIVDLDRALSSFNYQLNQERDECLSYIIPLYFGH